MALEVNGKSVETDANGNLTDPGAWDEDVARALAAEDNIELTQEHFDVLNYLRTEYLDNGGEQPMERAINKGMSKIWGRKITSKDLYNLFPGAPSKQGNKIAGLPYIARKGGY
ncbi:MAG: TusE/DsrC/DsvC family sulfur relay protein [Zetaproteobacteria bacterium]|nr:TusE/DsrC/DsvC family sulfur relay protein [Zetaproteobacteria bacterium]